MSSPTNSGMSRGSWLLVTCLVVSAIVYWICFFMPKMRSISATLAQLDTKQSFILESQKSRRIAEQARHEWKETLAYNKKYASQLLQPQALPTLYGQISQIAKSHELATARFEPQLAVAYDSLHKRSIGLGVSGSFSAIASMVRDLETLPARIWIDDMKMRGPRQDGKPVECDITLVVFIDNLEKTD